MIPRNKQLFKACSALLKVLIELLKKEDTADSKRMRGEHAVGDEEDDIDDDGAD